MLGQGLVDYFQQGSEVALYRAILAISLMNFDIETSVLDGGFVGLIDQLHPGAVGHLGKQCLDVRRVQPDAAVGYPHTYAVTLVGSVQEIAITEIEREAQLAREV